MYEDELMLGSNDTAHRMDSLSEQLLSAILLSAHIAHFESCWLASKPAAHAEACHHYFKQAASFATKKTKSTLNIKPKFVCWRLQMLNDAQVKG